MSTALQPWVLEELATGGLLTDWVAVSRHATKMAADRARLQRIRDRGYFSQAQLSSLRVSYRALP